MEAIRNLFTSWSPTARHSTNEAGRTPTTPTTDHTLQDQFKAQTVRFREIHKAQRPKNTTRAYEPKQKEWEDWCARLRGNTDGCRVTEDKLCLFLE
jgi:hypothetical protein